MVECQSETPSFSGILETEDNLGVQLSEAIGRHDGKSRIGNQQM